MRQVIKQLILLLSILLLTEGASALTPAPSATRLTTSTSYENSPALMQDSSGKIWLFYASDATGNNDIYYKTSSDGGASWSAEQPFVVDSSYNDGGYGISAMQDSSGKIWVAWAKGNSFDFDIYYKTSTDGGNTWSPSIRFTSYDGDDLSPSIFQDKTGKIWIIWRSYGIGGDDDIWAKTSIDEGSTWSSPIAISTDSAREDAPFATIDSSGKIWVVWRKEIGGYASGNWNIYMKASTDNGATWSSASEMTTEPGFEDHPSIIKDSSGKVWLFWDSASDTNISYKYSLDNGATWSGISQFTSSGSNQGTRMLQDSSGKVWLVWSSNAEGNYDIWSSIIENVEVITHKVAYIPVIYYGEVPPFSIDILKTRADKVTEYYKQQSYGKVNIGYEFVGKDCKECWTTLDKTFSEYDSPGYDASTLSNRTLWNIIKKDAIEKSNIVSDNYNAVVVIQPENVRAYTDVYMLFGRIPTCTLEKQIVIGRYDTYSTWAHELGHALFKFPDYYDAPCSGGNAEYWGLMGSGNLMNPPAPIISYDKINAGWLVRNIAGQGKYPIQLLSKMHSGDGVYEYLTEIPSIFYIFEGRYPYDDIGKDFDSFTLPDYWKCESCLWQEPGVLLYATDISGKVYTIPNPSYNNYYGNLIVTLRPDEEYPDDWAAVKFKAKKENSQLYIDIQPNNILNKKVVAILGIVTSVLGLGGSAEVLQTNISGDIDLHLYTYDGKHVGMNYTSLVYERQVGDSSASGNILGGGPEWISIPDNISAYYILDASPAREWAKELNVSVGNITATLQIVQYDENGTRRESLPFTINVSLNNPTVVGEIIYGTAFNDFNRNGKQDTGEVGLANWTIQLKGFDKLKLTSITRTAVTDTKGSYIFTNINPGTYFVYLTPLPMWIPTTSPASSISLKKGDSAVVDFGNRKVT